MQPSKMDFQDPLSGWSQVLRHDPEITRREVLQLGALGLAAVLFGELFLEV